MNFEDLDSVYFDNLSEDSEIDYCLSLLYTSGLSNEEKELIENELTTYEITTYRLSEIKTVLNNSQLDRINAGFNYNQTDIKRKLNREIYGSR